MARDLSGNRPNFLTLRQLEGIQEYGNGDGFASGYFSPIRLFQFLLPK
jgi:hypothetical protein